MTQKSTGHVFMSYSRIDENVMRHVVAFLRSRGINVWVDNEKLIPGTPVWETEIETAIYGADATVVILSPDSKTSEWVRREISYSERYQKRIFPVLVRGDENSSISIRLTNHQYVDIRDNREMGLEKLGTALSFYLEDLETRKRKALDEVEKQAQAKARQEKDEREAVRRKLEREKAEQEMVERERAEQDRLDRERLKREKTEKENIVKRRLEAEGKAKEFTPSPIKKKPDVAFSREKTGDRSVSTRWLSVLWIALGWGIGVSYGVSLLSMIAGTDGLTPTSFQVGRLLVGAIIGAFSGLISALFLRVEHIISQKRSLQIITLGWLAGWTIGWAISYAIITSMAIRVGGSIGGAIGGAIGGFAIAFSLRNEKVISSWKSVFIVTLGWSFAWALAETLLWVTYVELGVEIGGVLIGGVGGAVLIWQTRNLPETIGIDRTPNWIPVLGITFGWAFGLPHGLGYRLPVGMFFGMSVDEVFNSDLGWMIGLVLAGLICGLLTGASLKYGKIISNWKTIAWVALGWMLAFPIGQWIGPPFSSWLPWVNREQYLVNVVIGLIQGSLGGFATTVILRTEGILLQRNRILSIMLGWVIGLSLFWALPQIIVERFGGSVFADLIGLALSPLVGIIGGYILIKQIREVKS